MRIPLAFEDFPIGDPHPQPWDTRRLDPVSAVTGGLGLVGNVVGGILGNSAAKKAGQIQQQAANSAADQITQAAANVNPQISEAARNAGNQVVSAAGTAATEANTVAHNTGEAVNTATGQANNILNPYQDAGAAASRTLQTGLTPGGDFNKTPTAADLQIDPGFAFRLQQGTDTINRSAAARGGAVSGAALKDLTNYSQGAASQEYQNAFNRFQTSTQNRFSNLFGVEGRGQEAGTQQGNNLIGSQKYIGDTAQQANEFGGALNVNANQFAGSQNSNAAQVTAANTINAAGKAGDYRTGGAAAQAAGVVGGANAITGAISGGVNSVQNAALMNLLKNPAGGASAVTGAMPTGYSPLTLQQMGVK